MGVDWRVNIDQAWTDISYRSAAHGNLDPLAPDIFSPRPRHSAGDSRWENVKACVEMVREFKP